MSPGNPDFDSYTATSSPTVRGGDERGEPGGEHRPYHLKVDPYQNDKATEIKLLTFQRPHMRAFHYSWLGFFLAFTGWFAVPPLISYIKRDLHLTNAEVDNSNIIAVSGTIFARLLLGPVSDYLGPRTAFAAVLLAGAVPVACVGAVSSATGFQVVRFFVGFVGAAFVCCQFWTTNMFSAEIVGTANALAGGWGNMGAGFTSLVLPVIYDLFHDVFGVSSTVSWRVIVALPAVAMVLCASTMYFFSDDCPKGNYKEMAAKRQRKNVSAVEAFSHAAANHNTWVLGAMYAACFGVELMVDNALPQYLYEDYLKRDCIPVADTEHHCKIFSSVTSAGIVASIFGLMNIFSRPMGGYLSDVVARRWGMRGKLGLLCLLVLCEGLLLIAFSRLHEAWSGILVLILFSFCCQAACGATFGIVPSVSPAYVGAVSGMVGASGNLGAMCWGFLFRYLGDKRKGFLVMGFIVTGISVLPFLIRIHGHDSLLMRAKLLDGGRRGEDEPTVVLLDQDLRKSKGDDGGEKLDEELGAGPIRLQDLRAAPAGPTVVQSAVKP